MKKILFFALTLTLLGCATTAEQVAQKAEKAKKVAAALADRHFTVEVQRMHPLRGRAVNVSYGYELTVKGDTLVSYLPYFGRAYNVPLGGGKGLNFTNRIDTYHTWQPKAGLTHIEISTTNEEDTYQYSLDIFDNGSTSISVQMRQREWISYDGNVEVE